MDFAISLKTIDVAHLRMRPWSILVNRDLPAFGSNMRSLLLLLIFTIPLLAQDAETKTPESEATEDNPAGHSYHGDSFNEGPRQAAYLMEGTGNVHFPATCKDETVQKFIDQGVGQLHGFWYFESERSFRQAAALDPDCAIAYWGMAMSNRSNLDRARGFIKEAVSRKDKASKREQMYIDALAKFVEEYPEDKKKKEEEDKEDKDDAEKKEEPKKTKEQIEADKKKRDDWDEKRRKNYVSAYEKILYEFPDDIEAKALLGLALYENRSKGVPITSYFTVDALLKDVLDENPLHPVHHFIIHLWDYERPELAVASAGKCGTSAPGIAHMWHMPGHTYSRLKRYHDAVWQQEASARVDHAHMMRDRVLPDQIHNFAHNNEWLIRNLIHIGRAQDAIDLAKNMIDLPRHPKYNTLKKRGSANYGRMRLIGSLQSFQMWDEVLNIANTRYLETTGEEKDDLERQTLIGVAKFQTGDVMGGCNVLTEMMQSHQKLEQEQKAKGEEATKKAKEEKKDDKAVDKARKDAERSFDGRLRNLSKGIRELKGQLHLAFHAYEDALAEFEKVTGFDKGELARIQVLAGQNKKGLETIKKHVEKSEKETIPLAQSVAVNWLAGEKEKAKKSFESLREISSAVDLQAPVFAQLAPIAQELGFGNDWKLPREIPEDFGERPTLDSLGPFRWSPSPAKSWSLADHLGKEFSLKDYAGKPVIVIFYLGYGCLHCAEQLQAFAPMTEKFNEAGIEVVAISTDNKEDLKISHENYQEGKFPFPLVANPELDVFKAYRCYDDFENQTLHGTFLVNPDGLVLWQDISYEPFMEAEFLLKEAKRLLAPATTQRETLQTNAAPQSEADAGE